MNRQLPVKHLLSKSAAIWLIILISLVWLFTSIDWSSDRKVQKKAKASQHIVFSPRHSTTLAYNDFDPLKLTEKGFGYFIKLDDREWSGWIEIEGSGHRFDIDPADTLSKFYLRFDDDNKIYHITHKNTKNTHFRKRWNKVTFQIKGSEVTDKEDTVFLVLTR